jgi:hypothetical protein
MLGTAAGVINVYTVPLMAKASKRVYRFMHCFRPTLASLFASLCGPFRVCKDRGVEDF